MLPLQPFNTQAQISLVMLRKTANVTQTLLHRLLIIRFRENDILIAAFQYM